MTQEPSKWYDSNSVDCKDNGLIYTSGLNSYAHGDEYQKDVEPTREQYFFTGFVEANEDIRFSFRLYGGRCLSMFGVKRRRSCWWQR